MCQDPPLPNTLRKCFQHPELFLFFVSSKGGRLRLYDMFFLITTALTMARHLLWLPPIFFSLIRLLKEFSSATATFSSLCLPSGCSFPLTNLRYLVVLFTATEVLKTHSKVSTTSTYSSNSGLTHTKKALELLTPSAATAKNWPTEL